jgi:hypothetical protein
MDAAAVSRFVVFDDDNDDDVCAPDNKKTKDLCVAFGEAVCHAISEKP